jgi:hypothetical protein
MALIAVLAHEYGHVYWNDVLIDPPGTTNPNYERFCPGIFPTMSWNGRPQSVKWRGFADVADSPADLSDDPNDPNPPDPTAGDPGSQDVRVDRIITAQALNTKAGFKRARRLMTRLLALRRPWASMFAAFSANEDFVETFTLYVLMNASTRLTQLEISILTKNSGAPVTIDIAGDVIAGARPLLSGKLLCFDDYLLRNLSTVSWP